MGSRIKKPIMILWTFILLIIAAVVALAEETAEQKATAAVSSTKSVIIVIALALMIYFIIKARKKASETISGKKQKTEKAIDYEERFRKSVKLDIWVITIFWIIENIITIVAQKTALRIILYIILNTIIAGLLFAALYGFGKLSLKTRMAMKKEEGTFVGAIKGFFRIIMLVVIGIAIFCSMMMFMSYQPYIASMSQPITCNTNDCFASAADSCRTVDMARNEDFGTVQYNAKDCTFTKTIVTANESPDMKRLLEGKSLSCAYQEGNFDRRILTSMIEGVDNCDGDLKVILGELLIFA
ncbi:MAG: hypothetical protein WC852_04130 [Candidatus Nanoarchaeia archaeon]|jgi:hypothetical protein